MNNINHLELIQGSDEWKKARAGSLGASQIADMRAKTKNGYGASRANLLAQLAVERLTGIPENGYINAAMQHGIDTEPEARAAYEFLTGSKVSKVGLILHPIIKGTHASPDGLIGKKGLLEIKCPQSAQHIATLMGEPIKEKYILQMQWQMACSKRAWADFISYDPRLPEGLRMFKQRVERDSKLIPTLEKDVADFLAELDSMVAKLKGMMPN